MRISDPEVEAATRAGADTAGESRQSPLARPRHAGIVSVDPLKRQLFWRDALLRRMLAVADLVAAGLVSVALGLTFGGELQLFFWSAVFAPAWLLLAKLHGLYDGDHRSLRHLTVDEVPKICVWALTGTGTLALFLLLTPVGSLQAGSAVRAWLVAAVSGYLLRNLARSLWRRVTPPERALIIGRGALAAETRRKLELFPDIHVEVVGERDSLDEDEFSDPPIDRVIVASPTIDEAMMADVIAACRRLRAKLSVIPPVRGMFGTAVQLNHVADLPLVEYNTWDASRSTLLLKRVLDLVVSSTLLVVLAPLFTLIALALAFGAGRPVIFSQLRASVGGAPFRMYKFRTMVSNAEEMLADLVVIDELREPMFKIVDDPRVTRIGQFLRRTSLDELPQLVNVLRGEMSLVGPRPEQVELVARYRPEHQFRLEAKPGMTGPMQVFGRGALTFDERLAVEREYIANISLRRDLRILALTISVLFGRRGAY